MPISRRLFLTGSTAAATILLTGCKSDSGNEKKDSSNTLKLRIAETTDLHGNFFPYDFARNKDNKTNSLSHIYSFITSERQRVQKSKINEHFMLLDCGDNLQGEPILNIYNDGLKKGTISKHIVPEIFNFMKYDAIVMGNHDVEFGKKVYDHLKSHYAFPILTANALKQGTQGKDDKVKKGDGSRIPYFKNDKGNGAYMIKTFTIESKPDIKVAFFGVTTPESKVFMKNGDENGDIYFEDAIESAKYWLPKIQSHKPDAIICLCHGGFDYSFTAGQDKTTHRNYNPVQILAEQIPEFDIIFWGHDHHIKEEVIQNGVVLLGGNHYARELNIADITFTYNEKTKKYDTNIEAKYLQVFDNKKQLKAGTIVDTIPKRAVSNETFTLQPESSFMTKFGGILQSVKDKFQNTIVGTCTTTLSTKDAIFGDSAFNDLVHHLEKYAAKQEFGIDIDMSIAAPLKFSFPNGSYELTGKLSYADMWSLYFYDNLHAVITMSGAEIKSYLEYITGEWFNEMKSQNDSLLNIKTDDKGVKKSSVIYWNMDSFAGIIYDVDVSKPKGDRVVIKGLDKNYDGQKDGEFDLKTTYKVSVNSYRYGGGGGHFENMGINPSTMKNRTLFYSATGLRDYLIGYIKDEKGGTIAPKAIKNWKIAPIEWAKKGRAKDEPVIFKSAKSEH